MCFRDIATSFTLSEQQPAFLNGEKEREKDAMDGDKQYVVCRSAVCVALGCLAQRALLPEVIQ